MSPAVVVNHLRASRRVGLLGRRVPVLRGIDFVVRQGSIHGLVGQNGAGKSTTIQHLIGAARPESGSVLVAGNDPREPAARARLAFQPEQPLLPRMLTCVEVVQLHARLHGVSVDLAVLERCGLGARARTLVGRLSKGQQTRLALALTLLGAPDIFILDEPMSGLDPLGRDFVRNTIREQAARGATVLFSSHSLSDVEQLCDAVTVIHDGRVLASQQLRDAMHSHLGGASSERFEIAVAVPSDWSPPHGLIGRLEGGIWITDVVDDPLGVARMLEARGARIMHMTRRRQRLEDVLVSMLKDAGAVA